MKENKLVDLSLDFATKNIISPNGDTSLKCGVFNDIINKKGAVL